MENIGAVTVPKKLRDLLPVIHSSFQEASGMNASWQKAKVQNLGTGQRDASIDMVTDFT